jgi:3-isopropylmalate/(R)-2-methylmalate dehydratase small subunit
LVARAFKYGDSVDTDVIIPARYLTTDDATVLAQHVLEDLDPTFADTVRAGDVIVAGANFGCGSSREHAPIALKAAGVAAVVAESFARIFFRNAINTGLAILECRQAVAETSEGDRIDIDLDAGVVHNRTTGRSYAAEPLPDFVTAIVRAGGLIPWVRARRGVASAGPQIERGVASAGPQIERGVASAGPQNEKRVP